MACQPVSDYFLPWENCIDIYAYISLCRYFLRIFDIIICKKLLAEWIELNSQLSERPGFKLRLSHTKDSKNGTWCHLA